MTDYKQRDEPKQVSDGKHMRLVWQPTDGEGEASAHLIQRSMTTLRGHPTWKLYMEDIKLPIDRESADAPPRYVYLDDKACYTIYASGAYKPHELKEYWPFDFNINGIIKSGRMNRGRPAWEDEENKIYHKVPIRGKGKTYEMVGELEVGPYEPRRVSRYQSKLEKKLAEELANKTDEDVATETTTPPSTDRRRTSVKVGKSVQRLINSRANSPLNTNAAESASMNSGIEFPTLDEPSPGSPDEGLYPRRSNLDPSKHMRWQTPNRPLPIQSLSQGIKPLPLTGRPALGPSYHDSPNSMFKTTSQSMTEVYGGINPKRKLSETVNMNDDIPSKKPAKRGRSSAFDG
ncbi:hypothetical protein DM02DRAFT_669324 [Periconia macrospinosa]|uniref:Uncharacterized protein n=1 Tax=Periconia macrospinosa TaxID=97972 RepID=A0A2V1E1F6_9PLEO|nr:hypothetical protein DM02DRAFT_669324 [Periconia macrospinosa]